MSDYWLWDYYPLSPNAWQNIRFDREEWSDWLKDNPPTLLIRRWVTGPNGPSFLTEYTPADDYIADGYNGRHMTLNGLLQDEDRRFYLPLPQDLSMLQRAFPPPANHLNPSWAQVEAKLVASGHRPDELRTMTAPTLILLLADAGIEEAAEPVPNKPAAPAMADSLKQTGSNDRAEGKNNAAKGNEEKHRSIRGKLLELFANGEPYTTQAELAERFGCSKATINKAMGTPALKRWMVGKSKKLRGQPLNDVVINNHPDESNPSPLDILLKRENELEDLTKEQASEMRKDERPYKRPSKRH